jgi:hypothetical protein
MSQVSEPIADLPMLVPHRDRVLRILQGEPAVAALAVADCLYLELAIETADREAFDTAIRHLALRSRDPWNLVAPGVYQSPWADGFDGARLALPSLFTRIGVRGDPVVTIPNDRAVLVTGSRDTFGLRLLYELTRMLVTQERALHPGGFRLVDGGRWQPIGEGDRDLTSQAPDLNCLSSLQHDLDHEVVGGLVAEHIRALGFHVETLLSTEVEGITMTLTNLPREVPRLVIPHADLVACNGNVFAWYKLEAMLGRNLVVLDTWPLHYEVRRVPTLVEITHAAIKSR